MRERERGEAAEQLWCSECSFLFVVCFFFPVLFCGFSSSLLLLCSCEKVNGETCDGFSFFSLVPCCFSCVFFFSWFLEEKTLKDEMARNQSLVINETHRKMEMKEQELV